MIKNCLVVDWELDFLKMLFNILTIFPSLFDALDHGVIGKAKKNGNFSIQFNDIRKHAVNKIWPDRWKTLWRRRRNGYDVRTFKKISSRHS